MAMKPKEFLRQTENYAKQLELAKKLIVKTGLPKEKIGGKVYEDANSVIEVGASHEYGGVFDGVILPQRSFLRLPFLLRIKEIEEMLAKQFALVSEGKSTTERGLGLVGLLTVNISKKAFTTTGYGRWKPSKKKTGQTLIDTGLLRNSITFIVTDS